MSPQARACWAGLQYTSIIISRRRQGYARDTRWLRIRSAKRQTSARVLHPGAVGGDRTVSWRRRRAAGMSCSAHRRGPCGAINGLMAEAVEDHIVHHVADQRARPEAAQRRRRRTDRCGADLLESQPQCRDCRKDVPMSETNGAGHLGRPQPRVPRRGTSDQ